MQLICVFGFSYAKSRFSHDAAHIFTHFSLLSGLSTFRGWLEIKTGLLMTWLLYNWFTHVCLMKIGKLASAGQLCLM